MYQHLVVIGASAGGVRAIKSLISALPANFQAPIFLMMHVAVHGNRPSHLLDIINRYSHLPAIYPTDGQAIQAGYIYLAPPNRHMVIADHHIYLRNGPKHNHSKPSIDVLFSSAAHFGHATIGILLSGMLDDGVLGLLAIKKNKGTTIVQSLDEAEFQSMPHNALKRVDVDYCLPTKAIAELLIQTVSVYTDQIGPYKPVDK